MNSNLTRLIISALLLAGCASLPGGGSASATPTVSTSAVSTPQPTPASEGALTLTIWLPPSFDPASGSLAAGVLLTRLDEFTSQHPQVVINIRIKQESGAGGLLESLVRAKQAAPLALPDLVLAPGGLLLQAARAGVVYPQETLAAQLEGDDWYPFGVQLASVGGKSYGLPFAADALVTAHRSTAISQVPPNWLRLMDTRIAMGFAAADPLARFTLVQLLSLQASDEAEEGFDIPPGDLLEVFDFYSTGQARGVFPFWLTQYQSNEQTWQAFTEGRLPMVTAWTSRLFVTHQSEISGAPIPTQNGRPFTLVRGWVWAVTTPNTERANLAAELIEFLSTPEFLAQYSASAGLLPARPSSLAAWAPGANQALASQIVADAMALPDDETLQRWGTALTETVVALLKQEVTPLDAVENVQEALAAQ